MRFASFLFGGFITAIMVNPPERKLAKRTSVQWQDDLVLFPKINFGKKNYLVASKDGQLSPDRKQTG